FGIKPGAGVADGPCDHPNAAAASIRPTISPSLATALPIRPVRFTRPAYPGGITKAITPPYNQVMTLRLAPPDVLLVLDLQRDFLPHGALAVPDGDAIIPGINAIAARFPHVILTQDWHPLGHISFASSHPGKLPFDTIEVAYGTQHLWPDHCVQGTTGAQFDPRLQIPQAELILRKGFRRDIDSYSAFLEDDHKTPTGLAGYLRERNLTRLFFCG